MGSGAQPSEQPYFLVVGTQASAGPGYCFVILHICYILVWDYRKGNFTLLKLLIFFRKSLQALLLFCHGLTKDDKILRRVT